MLNLRWRSIGADALNLEDSKTGPRAVPLGEAARTLIAALSGPRNPEALVFPRYAEARVQSSFVVYWRAVCAMRHPAAYVCAISATAPPVRAVMAGENLPLVGRLLGHHRHRTTGVYAHLADAHLVEAAEAVGLAIARAMRDGTRLPAHESGRAAADEGARGAGGVRRAWRGVRDVPGRRMPR